MHWADKIAKEIISSGKYTPFWVDDMKTLSGYAHIGSIRGPLIHELIHRVLMAEGKEVEYTFVFNDFDVIDSLSEELKASFSEYMGVPLRIAPSPKLGFSSFAECFNSDFKRVFDILGMKPKFLSSWDMYHQGKFDEVIKIALDNSELIQDIYKKISGSEKKELGWLPFQVVCEKCGKLSTTRVFAWDGKEVSYKCEPSMISWAQGCGHEGKISPFGGTGKLPWKVDWPAHWKVIGVTIEGAGKDLASKGGAYDIAFEIAEKVFKYPKPYELPYEHFLIGGRKMSTSKGVGLRANQWIEIVPPEIGRFLFVKTDYRSALEFSPFGTMAIPDLFDDYDRAWMAYVEGKDEDLGRAFELSQITEIPLKEEVFLPRFRDIANYLQNPSVDLSKVYPKATKELLDERIKYAKIWLKDYAPETAKFEVKTVEKTVQAKARITFSKEFSDSLVQSIEEAVSPEELEKKIYGLIKESGHPAKSVFAEMYALLIGKPFGPKIAWLIWENKEKALEIFKKASK